MTKVGEAKMLLATSGQIEISGQHVLTLIIVLVPLSRGQFRDPGTSWIDTNVWQQSQGMYTLLY